MVFEMLGELTNFLTTVNALMFMRLHMETKIVNHVMILFTRKDHHILSVKQIVDGANVLLFPNNNKELVLQFTYTSTELWE